MRVSYLIAACLVAGVCLQSAHAVGNQLDVFADTTCNSTATSTFGTDEYGKCKDGSGQSSMMFCSNYGGATQLMTFVTFTNTGCSRNDVGMAGMVIADTTCQTAPDTVHGVEATCGATARPNSYNRVLFDAASTSCESAASLQEELLAKDGVCIPSIGGHSMLIWCGDRNLAVVSTFTTADCTGAETTTVLEKDNCQPVMVGTSSIGNLKVACDVGQSKNVFTHYTDSTCDGIPSFIALSDNGECVNASDSNPLLSRSVMSFHNDGKVHTAIWDVPDCQGAAAYSSMYAASTCTAGEPSLGATRWNADMDADTIGNPNLKVEHFYSANDCTGDADTDEHDNNGACFNHDATTTSVQAWCSQDKQLGVASLFSATGCGLPNHAQTVDFKSGVCFAVPGTSTESIKVTCGATAATLSALVLALPLLLAAWLRDTA